MKIKNDAVLDSFREFIDTVNAHVGAYVDACAGFAGNKARVERQVAKIMRQQRQKTNAKEGTVIVFASFDDPGHPDALHYRIVAASEFISANSEAGFNAQMHAFSSVVFLFARWDEVIRPKLASALGVETRDVKVDVMGDLRILRHAILHNDAVLAPSQHAKLKCLRELVQPGSVNLRNDVMQAIFAAIKSGIAELICSELGLPFSKTGPEAIKEIALPRTPIKHQFRPQ